MIILDHIVLNTLDVAKSADFYKKLLNVELENWEEFIDNKVKFPSLRISSTFIIDLFPPAMWNNQGNLQCEDNLNHFCLAVHAEQWLSIFNYCCKFNCRPNISHGIMSITMLNVIRRCKLIKFKNRLVFFIFNPFKASLFFMREAESSDH